MQVYDHQVPSHRTQTQPMYPIPIQLLYLDWRHLGHQRLGLSSMNRLCVFLFALGEDSTFIRSSVPWRRGHRHVVVGEFKDVHPCWSSRKCHNVKLVIWSCLKVARRCWGAQQAFVFSFTHSNSTTGPYNLCQKSSWTFPANMENDRPSGKKWISHWDRTDFGLTSLKQIPAEVLGCYIKVRIDWLPTSSVEILTCLS